MIPILISAVFWQKVVTTEPATPLSAAPSTEFCIKNPQYVYKTAEAKTALNKEYWQQYAKKKNPRESKGNVKNTSNNGIVKNGKTTIIIAPHPDDEILCCTNTITQKLAEGENVKIIYLTDGDAHSLNDNNLSQQYARKRRSESFLAAMKLGLTEDDLFFLGFPDGLLRELSYKPLRSKFTGQNSTPRDTFFPNTKYTNYNLKAALKTIITKFSPDEIYLPSVSDAHPDHKATGLMIRSILRNNERITAQGFEYLVHTESNESGEKADLKKANAQKLSLIGLFTSQFHTRQHRNFLEQFAAMTETFEAVMQRFAKK